MLDRTLKMLEFPGWLPWARVLQLGAAQSLRLSLELDTISARGREVK